jgi:hypothetical protein
MRTGNCLLYISAVLAVCLGQAGFEVPLARAQNAAILTGHVSSVEEGPMEGVVVSAKKDGATITVSVVTDSDRAERRDEFAPSKAKASSVRLVRHKPRI